MWRSIMTHRKLTVRNLGFIALAFGAIAAGRASAQDVVIGGKGFTEQLIMAEMTSQLLAANGIKPDKRVGMGTAIVRQALESARVDVYWEYTGTALSVVYK